MIRNDYDVLGYKVGQLVNEKQKQYGDSVGKTAKILKILYPNGIPVEAYPDIQLLIRILDKLSRIAAGKQGNENPFKDIAGYGILGWAQEGDKKDVSE